MSILPEQPESLLDDKRNTKKVTDPTVLITIANRMVNKVTVDENPEHRSKELIARWRVSNLLSAIDEATWHNMVSAALDGQRKTLLNMQPNGDWQPTEYEVEIREVDDEAVLLLGIRWTDERGEEDVQYHNGAPSVNVSVTAKSDPQNNEATLALLKMLAAGQLSANEAIAKLEGKITSAPEQAEIADDVEIKAAVETPKKKSNPRTGKRRLVRKSPSA